MTDPTNARDTHREGGSDGEIATPHVYELGPVPDAWIDENGHMNVLHYLQASEQATAAFYEFMGVGRAYRAENKCGLFAAEHHILYRAELRRGDPVRVTSVLCDCDEKRIHFVNYLHDGGGAEVAAAIEHVELHVDLATRRVSPFRAGAMERLRSVQRAHASLLPLPELSRAMGLRLGARSARTVEAKDRGPPSNRSGTGA